MTGYDFHRGGSGTPLVLLHGFSDTYRTWDGALPFLEPHHDVFAPALPGHVGGPALDPARDLVEDALDKTEAILEDAGIERAHIVGNSLGAWVALKLAERGRAESVVALAPAGGWVHQGRDGKRIHRYFRRNYAMLRSPGAVMDWTAKRPRLRALAMRDVLVHGEKLSAATARRMMQDARDCPAYRPMIDYGAKVGFGELAPIECPVHIVYADKDRLIRHPGCYERWPELVPGAEIHVLKGLGHLPQLDDPEATAKAILAVTSREPAPA